MTRSAMTEQSTPADEYCSDLVRGGDEDRWLAAHYAPIELRRALLALGALRLELKRIPAAVSEPPLGEIRLQWWRDALDEIRAGKPPRAHPVIEAVAASAGLAAIEWADIDRAIDAWARPLYGEGFSTAEDLEDWLSASEGGFDAAGARLAGGDEGLAEAATLAGAAFAMAREGPVWAAPMADACEEKASAAYRETAPRLAGAPAAVAPSLLHLALTPLYLRRGARRFPLRKRARLLMAMAFARY